MRMYGKRGTILYRNNEIGNPEEDGFFMNFCLERLCQWRMLGLAKIRTCRPRLLHSSWPQNSAIRMQGKFSEEDPFLTVPRPA